jgi:hypothetical protein
MAGTAPEMATETKKKKRKKKNVRPVTLHEDKVRERFSFSP